MVQKPRGGVLHYGVGRGCAPVLDSLWPENSGIGIYFYWKIFVIGVYFHLEVSGIGVYCYTQNSGYGCLMKVQLDNSSSNTWSVSSAQTSSIFCV